MPPRRSRSSPSAASPAADAPSSKKQKSEAPALTNPFGDDRLTVPVMDGSVVYIGHGLLTKIPAEILAKDSGIKASRFVIISDTNVFPLYGQTLIDAFAACGKEAIAFQVKAGEPAKCRKNKSDIEDFVLANKCQRDTCFLALGGGVVGDLTGYVAATFMRGVPVVQIPTSMMSMVDSSVGGKTAINVPAGKNLIGAFHQPRRVYADLNLLKSLHQREIDEGLAEVVKMGLIRRASLFDLMEEHVDQIRALERELILSVVHQAVSLKAEVVALDEKETGLRATLNFGHTVGHAVEGLASPKLLHGECVAIGSVYEAVLARDLGQLAPAAVGRITRVLKAYNLPTEIPKAYHRVPELMGKMAVDKKNAAGKIRCTILTSVGTSIDEPQPVEKAIFERLLSPRLTVQPQGHGAVGGTVHVPGSKSISNRVLLLAAMGQGETRIKGLLQSDDTQVMLNALRAMGGGACEFGWEEGGATLRMRGLGGKFVTPSEPMYLGNAGTAARFLTTCATLIKEEGKASVLTGDRRMKERPIKDLTDALAAVGCTIEHLESPTSLPIKVHSGGLKGGKIELSGKVSSQFVSSVLLSAPYAQAPVELVLKEAPVSQSYIDMTVSLMAQFGVKVVKEGALTYKIPQACYKNPKVVQVECDASSATYPLALAAITGGTVTCEAVGAASIQGDAAFAMLCKDMGCTVKQTKDKTTVTGPAKGERLKAIDVDMEPMTDAFMTAVALAAVAEGTTRITGIANQRVKECDRIGVMVSELGKLGITAGELDDGIWITGVDPATFVPRPSVIACHNDHRIAMSFAVLGSRISGVTIGQKSCVDKTYPEFWSDTHRHLGVEYLATDALSADSPAAAAMDVDTGAKAADATPSHPSVVIIGMRGAGKTHLGRAAATALGATFVDMDHAYEAKYGKIMDTVKSEGWPTFRQREAAMLAEALKTMPTGHVIACGGGVVETDAGRAVLRAYYPVVQAVKPIDEIEAYLGYDKTRPDLGEPPRAVYARRKPWYDACADFDHVAAPKEPDFGASEARLVGMLTRVLGLSPPPAMPHEHSFFLSLTFPDLAKALPLPSALWANTDAVELRCDLLESLAPENVQAQIATLRAHCPLPVIFTIRSKSEAGAYEGSDEQYARAFSRAAACLCMPVPVCYFCFYLGSPACMHACMHAYACTCRYLALNLLAVRAGCEWIDLEAGRDGPGMRELIATCKARHVRLLGSNHVLGPMESASSIGARLRKCELHGAADVAKFVGFARETSEALHVHAAAANAGLQVPYIALAMGPAGQMSRVLNSVYTPVTHPLLPSIAAPGQMSVEQILGARKACGYLPSRSFYIFGSPTKHSPSPAMHNAAFGVNGTAHTYGVCETEDVDVVLAKLKEPGCGGGSVTIPLKEKLMDKVDVLSKSATAIGALNTLSVQPDGSVHADNTDWIGIRNLLRDNLKVSKPDAKPSDCVALVLGARGTARAAIYALKDLRIGTVYVCNRSVDQAEAVAAEFGCTVLPDLTEGVTKLARLDLVVSCVPGSAGLTIPVPTLQSLNPIVLDAAYRPRETPLLSACAQAGVVAIEGIEMLFEQGCAQAVIWTHRPAPRKAIVEGLAKFTASQDFGPLPKRLTAEL